MLLGRKDCHSLIPVAEVALSNDTLSEAIFTLSVSHNYTVEGIAKGKKPIFILTGVLGGLALIVTVCAGAAA